MKIKLLFYAITCLVVPDATLQPSEPPIKSLQSIESLTNFDDYILLHIISYLVNLSDKSFFHVAKTSKKIYELVKPELMKRQQTKLFIKKIFLEGTILDLAHADLERIYPGVFDAPEAKKLQFLSLEGNQLTTLPTRLFCQLSDLEYLSLADNQLTQLNAELFGQLKNLKFLDLKGNRLTNIEQLKNELPQVLISFD